VKPNGSFDVLQEIPTKRKGTVQAKGMDGRLPDTSEAFAANSFSRPENVLTVARQCNTRSRKNNLVAPPITTFAFMPCVTPFRIKEPTTSALPLKLRSAVEPLTISDGRGRDIIIGRATLQPLLMARCFFSK
jgi:hypothetical protein